MAKEMNLSPNQLKELKISSRKYKQQIAQLKFLAKSRTPSMIKQQKVEPKIVRHNIYRPRDIEEQGV